MDRKHLSFFYKSFLLEVHQEQGMFVSASLLILIQSMCQDQGPVFVAERIVDSARNKIINYHSVSRRQGGIHQVTNGGTAKDRLADRQTYVFIAHKPAVEVYNRDYKIENSNSFIMHRQTTNRQTAR